MKRLLRGKGNIYLLGLLLSIFLFYSSYAGVEAGEYQAIGLLAKATPSSKKMGRSLIGKMAPDFILDSITGEKYQLSSTRGKVVLIDFWHTY